MDIRRYTNNEDMKAFAKGIIKTKDGSRLEETFGEGNIASLFEHAACAYIIEHPSFNNMPGLAVFDSIHPFLERSMLEKMREANGIEKRLSVSLIFPFFFLPICRLYV